MTASDWGPDSPATTRFRAFYDWPAPVEFDAELPDDIDGPDDERDFLLDAAPFAKQRAVRVEPVVPASTVAQGATNTPNPDPSAIPSGNDGSGDLRAEALKLARLLDPIAFDDRAQPQNLGQRFDQYSRQQTARDHATIALIRGYRLVSEDDTTVDRVARAMHLAGCQCGMSFDDHQVSMLNDFGEEDEGYVVMARAAVRALREAGSDA